MCAHLDAAVGLRQRVGQSGELGALHGERLRHPATAAARVARPGDVGSPGVMLALQVGEVSPWSASA